MSEDSADVWANKDIFLMDEDGRLRVHAGVPPDVFSGEGQDWGNPLYDWEYLKKTGYNWWMKRLRQCAERFDILRIDHFRGLSEYYAIPEGGTPLVGNWQHGPALGFIAKVREMLKKEGLGLVFLAEDLGYLDAGSMNLLKLSGFPGMDIWQFSADEMMEMSEKEPEKAEHRAYYSGTHDNNTLIGYICEKRESGVRSGVSPEVEALDIISRIYGSHSRLVMLQLQDVFMLGSEARMNVPGIAEGNWTWHLEGGTIWNVFPSAGKKAAWLHRLAAETGRYE
jgi:4-alpha-glucanotransferase